MKVIKVYISPLTGLDSYGSEVDVSDYVDTNGISKIKRSIDSTDYSLGIYRMSDINVRARNDFGTFNENDSRSIFPYIRDRAKVRIEALQIDGINNTTTTTKFEGIINDEATRLDHDKGMISFKVLSKNSLFRTVGIPAGRVVASKTIKQAIFRILNQNEILALLTIDIDNINPDYDFVIDDGSFFGDMEVQEALNLLMLASNSVLTIANDIVYVYSRNSGSGSTLELTGDGSLTGITNIISIQNYNNGKHRQFNSVIVNGSSNSMTADDDGHINDYGLRQISIDLGFVNNTDTLMAIATNILEEFRFPKIELEVMVPTSEIGNHLLLGPVSIDNPWIRIPAGDYMPVLGQAVLGASATPLPNILGSFQILDNIKFKSIEIEDNLQTFETKLKLRQFGFTSDDGYFT